MANNTSEPVKAGFNWTAFQGFCIDFILPTLVLVMLFVLMLTGIDGEVKTLMAGIVGWITHSGVTRARKAPKI